MEEQHRARGDTTFAIIAIVAGLLTGAVLTYVFLQPEQPLRYVPEYRVPDEQRMPMDSAGAVEGDGASSPAVVADGSTSAATDPADDASEELPSGADRAAIEGAREHLEAEGVTDYAQLTEELYVRVSARLVLAATALSEALGPDADPTEAQHLLAEKAAEVLAEARIDPDDYWAYTRDVHSDPDRAAEMGEKILREAEKHTERRITIREVPGLEPTPVPDAPPQ